MKRKDTRRKETATPAKPDNGVPPTMSRSTPAGERRKIYEVAYESRQALSTALDRLTDGFADWLTGSPVSHMDQPYEAMDWWEGHDYVEAIAVILRLLEEADEKLSAARAGMKGRR